MSQTPRLFLAATGSAMMRTAVVGMLAIVLLATGSAAGAAVRAGGIGTAGAASTFGKAVEVPPPPQSPATGRADSLATVSCAQPTWCAAGGAYFDKSGYLQPMVIAQVRGHWTRPVELQLPDNRATVEESGVNGIACASAGNCVAVGSYVYSSGGGRYAPFIAADVSGTWRPAFQAWLPANAEEPVFAELSGVSCTAQRNCTAVGWYFDKAGNQQLMVVTEINGTWRQAKEIAAPTNAASPVSAIGSGISCYHSGDCVAVGGDQGKSGQFLPLTFKESDGVWHRATTVLLPAKAAGGSLQSAPLDSVSCTSTGACLAVGNYLTGSRYRPMAVSGSKGLGARAAEVTALPTAAGRDPYQSLLYAVSCVSASSCVAAGQVSQNNAQPFYAMSLQWQRGRWGGAQVIAAPGATAKNTRHQDALLWALSCYHSGYCVTVGEYNYQAALDLNGASMAAVRG
jgi:hypothetical protein